MENFSDELRSLVSNDTQGRKEIAIAQRALPDIIRGDSVREDFSLTLVLPLTARTVYILHSDVVQVFLKLAFGLIELKLAVIEDRLARATQ